MGAEEEVVWCYNRSLVGFWLPPTSSCPSRHLGRWYKVLLVPAGRAGPGRAGPGQEPQWLSCRPHVLCSLVCLFFYFSASTTSSCFFSLIYTRLHSPCFSPRWFEKRLIGLINFLTFTRMICIMTKVLCKRSCYHNYVSNINMTGFSFVLVVHVEKIINQVCVSLRLLEAQSQVSAHRLAAAFQEKTHCALPARHETADGWS